MKKIFILAVSLGFLTTSFAQDRRGNEKTISRDVILGQKSPVKDKSMHDKNIGFNTRERDSEINRINRDYELKIQKVKNNRSLRSVEKNLRIKMLEQQCSQEIFQVKQRYTDRHVVSNGRRSNNHF